MKPDAETTLSSQLEYSGLFLNLYRDAVRLADGSEHLRDVVTHPGGVLIVPQLPDGSLILVQQYRYAIKQLLLEFPAGKREAGEDPLETAKRELAEETGYQAQTWQAMGSIVTSPGFCDERLWLFWATDLTPTQDVVRPEDEIVETVPLTPAELEAKIQQGEIEDAKTLAAWQRLSSIMALV